MEAEQNCPNCGALIGTGVPGLPVVTCGSCNSLLSKAGDQLSKVGEAGRVPFDVSPIQIGTRLTVGGARGEIVGRERWAYDGGFWNEWLLQFPNGDAFWVAEETGKYMVMTEVDVPIHDAKQLRGILQSFGTSVGKTVQVLGEKYTVADVKRVRCVAVEGSLPHPIGADVMRKSLDLRTRNSEVLTFQSDKDGDSLWRGAYYTLADLEPAGLRRFEHWSAPDFEAAR
ncbi:MAG: DUF4178 domain-containing protein [Pseudomonadota bacterium]